MSDSFLGEDYLEVRDLTVDFDGFKAIQGVDVTFLQGRLHFLIGPNGAGQDHAGRRPHRAVARDRRRRSSAAANLLTMKVARDRAPRRRPDLPDGERVREAQRPAEPRHRRRPAPRDRSVCCGPDEGCPSASSRCSRPSACPALANRPAGILAHGQKQWLEIGMLLVQDAQGDVPRRDRRRHERRGAPGDRRAAAADRRATGPSSSSSTTWTSCAATPTS